MMIDNFNDDDNGAYITPICCELAAKEEVNEVDLMLKKTLKMLSRLFYHIQNLILV